MIQSLGIDRPDQVSELQLIIREIKNTFFAGTETGPVFLDRRGVAKVQEPDLSTLLEVGELTRRRALEHLA